MFRGSSLPSAWPAMPFVLAGLYVMYMYEPHIIDKDSLFPPKAMTVMKARLLSTSSTDERGNAHSVRSPPGRAAWRRALCHPGG